MKRIVTPVIIVLLTFIFASYYSFVYAQSEQTGNVAVEAVIPPHQSDFQFDFSADTGSPVHQNQTIRYTIHYGARDSAGVLSTNTIVVHYANDLAPDSSYAADYVIGSATDGYWGAHPVVDLINRTITWTIVNLPSGTTDQEVSFDLKTNSSYTLKNNVQFVTHASMTNEFVSIPNIDVYLNYRYDPSANPPPPTPTINLTPGPSPTPDLALVLMRVNDISLTSLTENQATLQITANKPVFSKIKYGISPAAMTSTVQTSGYNLINTVDLPNLKPNTPYYYQLTAYDTYGHFFTTDIYTFTTPGSTPANLNQNEAAVTVTSGNLLLLSEILKGLTSSNELILLPENNSYLLTYTPSSLAEKVSSVELLIRASDGTQQRIAMTQDGLNFSAALQTSPVGSYDLILVQTDDKGNVMSTKIASLKISPRLRVIDAKSRNPIGDARVVLSRYDTSTKTFKELTNHEAQNPFYTDKNGEGSLILAPGQYGAEANAIGYDTKAQDFTLGKGAGEDYPTIELTPNTLNLTFLVNFIKDVSIDTYTTALQMIMQLSASIRYYNLVAFTGLGSLTILTALLFHLRTNIKIGSLLPFVLFHLSLLGQKHKGQYIYGTITDKNNKRVSGARIEVVSLTDTTILMHTISDNLGNFHIRNTFSQQYLKLIVTKDNFPLTEQIVQTDGKKPTIIKLGSIPKPIRSIRAILLQDLAGGFFEIVLLVSLVSELMFLQTFGVMRTLPFIALSLLNLALWLFYQRKSF